MSYRIRVNNQFLDLFPNQEISIGADYYDTTNIDAIKIPFSFKTEVPYTEKNKTILDYDDSSGYGGIPLADYDYEIIKDSTTISSGKARVQSVVINSLEPIFNIELRDKVSEFSKNLRELTFADVYNDSFSTQVRTLSAYLTINQGYNQRDIEIPFIDFDNIQKTTGYESRQFTSWGTTGKKFGLMPALRVVDFIDRVFTAANITYTSKFVSGASTWDATNLYMLYPTYLSATPVSKRESFLFPFPYNVQLNSDQELYTGDVTINGTDFEILPIRNYKLLAKETYEPFGPTNYGPSNGLLSREYGDQWRTPGGVTDWGDENVGYVSYGSGFDAKFLFNSGNVTIAGLKVCALSTEDEINGEIFPHYISNISSVSNAVFTPYVLIYESYMSSSVPKYKIPIVNPITGEPIQLSVSGLQSVNGSVPDDDEYNLNPTSIIQFATFTGKIDDTIAYPINGGSTYSCAIGVYMDTGYIEATIQAVARNKSTNNITVKNVTTGVQLEFNDIKKFRTFGYDWSTLGIKVDNIGSVAATCPNDNFQFQESLENNKSIKVYDVMIDLMKRFGLSVLYDYTSGDVIIDNLKDIRLTQTSMDGYLDTLKPFEVESGVVPPKTLKLLNKENDGIYDKFDSGIPFGSFDGTWKADGSGEKTIEFISSLIHTQRKSVCGEEFFMDPLLINNGLVPIQEVGEIKNEIPDYDRVGLRIFYLREPDYKTSIRYPVFRQFNSYGQKIRQVVYKLAGIFTLQGYPVNELSGSQFDLRFAFEDGTTTASYNYLVTSERFVANESSKMTFYAAIPDTMFESGDLYKKKFVFNKTGEKFIVNSLTDAKFYNDYVYGKFEVIFVD
jgi:hypothetical protein